MTDPAKMTDEELCKLLDDRYAATPTACPRCQAPMRFAYHCGDGSRYECTDCSHIMSDLNIDDDALELLRRFEALSKEAGKPCLCCAVSCQDGCRCKAIDDEGNEQQEGQVDGRQL